MLVELGARQKSQQDKYEPREDYEEAKTNYPARPSFKHVVSLTRTSIIRAMDNSKSDSTLDRLFRHMAWANQILLQKLQEVPVDALALSSENKEWTVGVITEHFVRSAGFYCARVTGEALPGGFKTPSSHEDLRELATRCADFDAMLRQLASQPEGMTTYQREGKTIHRARSTILGQSIHHATEHRAQIADILSLHGIRAIDLDEMDVWAYSDAEGLGN